MGTILIQYIPILVEKLQSYLFNLTSTMTL